jgi:magnesium chelatase family protein
MLAKLNTFALVGIDAVPVVAEVDVSVGLPKTVLVGEDRPIQVDTSCMAW